MARGNPNGMSDRATVLAIENQLEAEGTLGITRRAANAVLSPHVKTVNHEELERRQLIGEGPALWEQLSMENDKQYSAFLLYRGMEQTKRSLRVVGEQLSQNKQYNPDYVKVLSAQYFWYRRARSFDVYAERQRLLEAEDKEALAGRGAPNWVLRSKKARDYYYELAQDIKNVAKEVLDKAAAPSPTSVADDEDQGNTLEDTKEISLGMKVSDWVSFVRLGYTLEKSALEWQTTGVTGVARKPGKGKSVDADELPMEDMLTMSAKDIKAHLGRLGGKSGSTTKQ